jgi:uncharacterized protein HemX
MKRMTDVVALTAPLRLFLALLLVALGLGLQACAPVPVSQSQVDEQRAEIRAMANETMAQLYQQYPESRRLLQDWLDAGAQLDAATPFLRMVLQSRKANDSPEEHPP